MADTERVWLVSRTYTDRDLVVLEYATPDGERYLRRELAARAVGADVTAARDVSPERLHPVEDGATRERYRVEAERMAERHDPDETV